MALQEILKYVRTEHMPHIWCPGCGNGIIMHAMLEAIHELQLDQNQVAVVSGIGCSARTAGYVDFNTLHTTHGRAIAFATGVKLAKPELTTLVVTGDGDCTAIGGNHLIHAARRNIDLTVIIFNNNIYGMTSGQYSPTTPTGSIATTAPFGNPERNFDICKLVEAAGASYVARSTTYHARALPNLIQKAILNKGFSLVEVMTHCPTYYGRINRIGNATEMLKVQRDSAVTQKDAASMTPEQLESKYVIGELVNRPAPEYCEEYQKIVDRAREGGS